jgi:NitT/TauT family transport system permease protein
MASVRVPTRGTARRGPRLPAATPSIVAVVAFLVLWQLGSTLGWWAEAIAPAPSEIWAVAGKEIVGGPFLADASATVVSVLAALVFGLVLGTGAGVLFWRKQALGKIFEPYLVSFYAVPLVVFYPIFIVLIGINRWPIIILSSVMAAIPMALNTWVGLSEVRAVYLKLSDALCLTPWQRLRLIAMPAAAPLVLAGATMAGIYALIGVVAMEFVIAQQGLGFRIRFQYESFDSVSMYFYIVATLVLALLLVAFLALLPRLLGTARKGEA